MRTLQFREPTTAEGRFIRQMSSRDSYVHVVLLIETTDMRMLSRATPFKRAIPCMKLSAEPFIQPAALKRTD